MLAVGVVYLAVGAVFGAMDVVVVAYAEAEGAPALAGVALAVYAGGSLVAGLVYGVVQLPGTLAARYVGCAVFFGVAAQLLFAVDSLVSLVAVVFVAGLAIAPVLVSGMSLVESRVPRVGAHRGADLGGHRPHPGRDRRLGAGRARPWTRGVPRPRSPSPRLSAALAGVLAWLGAPLLRGPGPAAAVVPERVERPVDG